jgi:TonB family protein
MIVRIRRSYFSEKEFRKNRLIAVVAGIAIHLMIIGALFFYQQERAAEAVQNPDDLNFGSSGGGGAENANEGEVEFGPQQATQEEIQQIHNKATVHLIDIKVLPEFVPMAAVTPVKEPDAPKIVYKKPKPKKSILAENLPIGHVRHGGAGPGSGGGEGGGSGGGIGARVGYAIDWGGTGGRRLLSGRIPRYPEGTDQQMLVVLKFSVLPDGSVSSIIPLRRYDELLERAAVSALQTWRFDPLPPQVKQVTQNGQASFNFKFELSER